MMIELNVCGKSVKIKDSSIQSLIAQEKLNAKGIALAVNEKVIPKSRWDQVTLSAGDRVEIFSVVAGG